MNLPSGVREISLRKALKLKGLIPVFVMFGMKPETALLSTSITTVPERAGAMELT